MPPSATARSDAVENARQPVLRRHGTCERRAAAPGHALKPRLPGSSHESRPRWPGPRPARAVGRSSSAPKSSRCGDAGRRCASPCNKRVQRPAASIRSSSERIRRGSSESSASQTTSRGFRGRPQARQSNGSFSSLASARPRLDALCIAERRGHATGESASAPRPTTAPARPSTALAESLLPRGELRAGASALASRSRSAARAVAADAGRSRARSFGRNKATFMERSGRCRARRCDARGICEQRIGRRRRSSRRCTRTGATGS
mgnify:CR=1 FL=1